MTAHLCAHPGVRSATSNWRGAAEKGHSKKIRRGVPPLSICFRRLWFFVIGLLFERLSLIFSCTIQASTRRGSVRRAVAVASTRGVSYVLPTTRHPMMTKIIHERNSC